MEWRVYCRLAQAKKQHFSVLYLSLHCISVTNFNNDLYTLNPTECLLSFCLIQYRIPFTERIGFIGLFVV